ncbi:hypothetical protein GCM10011507_22760 [Edaphobacter acidisoli]|uniref:Uncharacterized protein n=1 Tax=Edaphobacter acidisoli TaxID=2040573 RepID=A0A916RU73_9BACT|nr:hypothetical protein [Edaphobacter acidisoli]GGA70628.1 hypothetical protein GCM10011507_22760 [Edaphobacter acidisoli]
MPFPIKVCAVCGEEFELRPDKPGFANRCPSCSVEPDEPPAGKHTDALSSDREANAARKAAIRNLLYRKDS